MKISKLTGIILGASLITTASVYAADAKCGTGKCGAGTTNQVEKKTDAKCGTGKCGAGTTNQVEEKNTDNTKK